MTSHFDNNEDDQFPVIFSYTRAQALADGVLVDVTAAAKEAGFKLHSAMTQAAYAETVAWNPEVDGEYLDEKVRLWDVVSMLRGNVVAVAMDQPEVLFDVYRIPRKNAQTPGTVVTLRAIVHPGDNGEPVMTILLPDED